MQSMGTDLVRIIEIIWVNIILSGDNAVVIAMACRGLPAERRRIGMALGAGVAVALRIVFTLLIAALLATPYLRLIGAILLCWVAVKLVGGEEEGDEIRAADKLWAAVRTIAIADAVMSLDNVLAIAAVAKDSTALLVLGLVISVPLIVVGASLIVTVLERFPALVWFGAALLGWIAGDMAASDPAVVSWLGAERAAHAEYPAAIAGVVLVLGIAWLLKRRSAVPAGG